MPDNGFVSKNGFSLRKTDHLYPTMTKKAACLCFCLISDHPFLDGNKRTGILAMRCQKLWQEVFYSIYDKMKNRQIKQN